ncbi:MAG TPA: helix-turn-helix transcriptional regulator [Oscillospiraceae bacterium]|nr:helix-turn-helix transcriptional regulator [Oscillospiraceae bacterium]
MNFGDVLRALLEERNTTQKQLANDLNIAPSTIGGYVQNSSEPDFETLKRLAKYFDVSTDYLLNYRFGKTATYQEDDLLRIFRSLSPEQRELYLEQGKVFIRINQKEKAKSS